MGPVQVLVVGLEQPTFTGEVATELAELREAGIVRLIDVLAVSRNDDGTFETLDPVMGEARGDLVAQLLTQGADHDASDDADLWSLADVVGPGAMAAVALIEHVWAGPLRDAIQRAGGVTLDETWLSPADTELLEGLIASRGG